jgi:hypothetical protein
MVVVRVPIAPFNISSKHWWLLGFSTILSSPGQNIAETEEKTPQWHFECHCYVTERISHK